MFQPSSKSSIAIPKLQPIYTTALLQPPTHISNATTEHAFRRLGAASCVSAQTKAKANKQNNQISCKSSSRPSMRDNPAAVSKKQRIRFVPRDRSVSGFSAHTIATTTMMKHSPTTQTFLDVYRDNLRVERQGTIATSQVVNLRGVSSDTLKALQYVMFYTMLTPLRRSLVFVSGRFVDWDQCLLFLNGGIEWWRRVSGMGDAGDGVVVTRDRDRWEGFLGRDCEPF